jgi:hypothetical protein
MSWDIVAAAVGGSSVSVAVVVAIALYLFDRAIQRRDRLFEDVLERQQAVHNQALQVSAEIDIDLRERRITHYTELWLETSILPKWPRANDVTYERLHTFSMSLRDWYFKGGGMFLSYSSSLAYRVLQDLLTSILDKHPAGLISEEHYDQIRDLCSKLRTELTNDLLSRIEAPVRLETEAD